MKLIKPEELATQLNKHRNIFNVQAFQYRAKHGKYPSWFVHNPKRGLTRIDADRYLKLMDTPKHTALYATSKLYWALKATNHSDSDIARLMVDKSKYFKSLSSWHVFITKYLFARMEVNNMLLEPTMLTEFVKIGTKHLYLLRKWNRLDLSKVGDYYEEL